MAVYIGRSTENVDHVDVAWNICESAKNFLAKNHRRVRIVNRYRNDFVTCALHVLRHVDRGLIRLRVGLDAEDGYALGMIDQVASLLCGRKKIILPVHVARLTEVARSVDRFAMGIASSYRISLAVSFLYRAPSRIISSSKVSSIILSVSATEMRDDTEVRANR
jgi:hypothetical protein